MAEQVLVGSARPVAKQLPRLHLSAGRVPSRVLLDVTRQLAAFAESGIPIVDALDMLAASTSNRVMRRALAQIAQDIRSGATLPAAAAAHPRVFPNYYLAMLEAAERTGNLTATFDAIASYLERDSASKHAVQSALAYPAVLLVIGTVAVVVLSVYVLPRFAEFFSSLDVELPAPTRALLAISAFVAHWWWAMALTVLLLTLSFLLVSSTKRGGQTLDAWKVHTPAVGVLARDVAMERFCRVLANLAGAGVPLVDALRLCSTVVGNRYYQAAIESTRDGVIRGSGLSQPMADTKAFPNEVVQVLRVGEQTGRLTEQLDHAAAFYRREVDYRLKTMTALLEPIALVLVGSGVGFVAVALVSAMYGIYSSVYVGGQ